MVTRYSFFVPNFLFLAENVIISPWSLFEYIWFLSDFMAQHPGIDLVMDVTNKTQVVRSLEQNEGR